MNKWKEVLAPKLGTNDEYVIITQWLVDNGEKVEKNQPIAVLESTKATIDFETPFEGYLYIIEEEFNEVVCGKAIGIITDAVEVENGYKLTIALWKSELVYEWFEDGELSAMSFKTEFK
jgi:2-oxoglutarate dehydrogenase E2 component (dihydrolipoamide succinyltransferase)